MDLPGICDPVIHRLQLLQNLFGMLLCRPHQLLS
jgi:hypothetical protein